MHKYVPDWVFYNSRRNPGALALENIDTGERLTWRQLEDRVAAVAGLLRAQYGIANGDHVALIAESDFRVFELQFACIRLGAVLVPLNWRLTAAEVATLLVNAEPTLLVHDTAWGETAERAANAVGLRRLLEWDVPGGQYDKMLSKASPFSGSAGVAIDDPTHILYTSGTTGVPKGALVTNRTLLAQVHNTLMEYALGFDGAKYLSLMPLFHAGGLTSVSAPMLATGGAVAFAKRFDPDRASLWLAGPEYGITHVNGTPVFFDQITQVPDFEKFDFSHVRHAHNAGAAINNDIIERWATRGLKIQAFYGGTEMGPTAMALPAHRIAEKRGSSGIPLPLTRARLVGDDMVDVAAGIEGEIWLAGPSISPGYWRRERSTEEFVGEWLRTGDVARRDDEGYFYIVDRLKDMFKSGGESVFPAEIERELGRLDGVAEVAVIGVPDKKWGEVGCAIIVPKTGRDISLEMIQSHLSDRLARYKIPKSLKLLETLPRNALGKIDKKALRRLG